MPASIVDSTLASLQKKLEGFEGITGLVTARRELSPNGDVRVVEILSNTFVPTSGDTGQPAAALRAIQDFLGTLKFPPAPDNAWITLPVKLPLDSAGRKINP